MSLTVGSLFAGIGGFDLGLERAGFTVRWQVEIEPYCQAVLAKHWPAVTRYGDIKTVRGADVEPVDVLCGGFPCQDISWAGTGAGIDGARSGLWGELFRLVCELRPSYVLVENVPALLARGIGRVLGDLASIGYDAEWSSVSACALGSPHMRQRVFIVAYPNGEHGWPRLRYSTAPKIRTLQIFDGFESARSGYRTRLENPSALYRDAHGVSNRMDRNRGLGNAIVPQIAEWIGRRILEAEAQITTQ